MTRRSTVSLLAIALLGCRGTDGIVLSPNDGGSSSPQLTSISLVQYSKIDLLFMVDNSPSMAPKQTELKNQFPALMQILDDFGRTAPASYHIGVVTSDLGSGQFNLGGGQCHPGGDGGKLQALGAAHDPACLAPTGGVNFIQYDQQTGASNLPTGQDLSMTFSCMASVGDVGCGFESQLESVYRALHDNIPENAGFLRPDALLVVVWITDEDDDCSAPPDSDLFDPAQVSNYGALVSYRGTQFGVACNFMGKDQLMPYGASGGNLQPGCHAAPNPTDNSAGPPPPGQGKCYDVNRYISFFTKPASLGGVKADPSAVVLAAIDGPTNDVESILADPIPGPVMPCSGPIDGKTCAVVLKHSCVNMTNTEFFADPAVRISQVLNAAGESVTASICDAPYLPSMQTIGQKIVANLGAPGCLTRGPADPSAPVCAVNDATNNADGSTTTTALPSCSASGGSPPCWHLVGNPSCTGGFQIQITRVAPPPANLQTTAACHLVAG